MEPLDLSDQEIDQVVAFLFTLTDRRFAEQDASELTRQRAIATERRPFRDDAIAHRRKLQFESEPRTPADRTDPTMRQGSGG